MAGIAQYTLGYATRLGAALARKKTVFNKNVVLLLTSPSTANNAVTPIRPPTLLPITVYKAKPVARYPATTSNAASATLPSLPPKYI